MRLKEEKILIGLGIIAAFILLVVVFIQIADNQINNYNQDLLLNSLEVNRLFTDVIGGMQQLYHDEWLDIARPEIQINAQATQRAIDSGTTCKKWNNLAYDIMNGTISYEDFFNRSVNLRSEIYESSIQKYLNHSIQFEIKVRNKPSWYGIKSILIPIEIFLILLNGLGYFYLHHKIKNRINH